MLPQRSKHPREMVITPKASTSNFRRRRGLLHIAVGIDDDLREKGNATGRGSKVPCSYWVNPIHISHIDVIYIK